MSSRIGKLIFIPVKKDTAKIRLVCFPYAGGSSATYIRWNKYLGKEIELACIELPGRGARFAEPCYTEVEELTEDLAVEILDGYCDKTISFYGHSMGAKIAYLAASDLYKKNINPHHLFISGSAYPGELKTTDIHQLPDDEFILEIKKRYGDSQGILNDKEMAPLFIPRLKADFKLVETMDTEFQSLLPCGASLLFGTHDPVELKHMYRWKDLFSGKVDEVSVRGDHFFVDERFMDVVNHINKVLGSGIKNNA
jgi:medium-chain acyl-[acyl-carrier-protein] hydrolase